jgi:hypothetical protein
MPTPSTFRARARIVKKVVQADSREDKPTYGRPQLYLELDVFESYEEQTKTWTPLAKPGLVKVYWPFAVADRNTGEVCWWESKINSCRKALGWDGQTWESLEELDVTGHVIQIVGDWGEYRGKRKAYVKWLNPNTDAQRAAINCKTLDSKFPPPPSDNSKGSSDNATPF